MTLNFDVSFLCATDETRLLPEMKVFMASDKGFECLATLNATRVVGL